MVDSITGLKSLKELFVEKQKSFTGGQFSIDSNNINKRCSTRVIISGGDGFSETKLISVVYERCLFNCELDLGGCEISGSIKMNQSFFDKEFCFLEGSIQGGAYFTDTFFANRVTVDSVTFSGDFMFLNAKFLDVVEFNNCKFEGEVCFENAVFGKNVKFVNCTFKKKVDFRLTGKILPQDSEFLYQMKCSFENSTFEKSVNFYRRHFIQPNFNRVIFNDFTDFHSTVFHSPVCFYQTEFHNTCIFGNAVFEGVLVFAYSRVALNMSFHNANIKNGLNLAYVNFIDRGKLELFEIEIKEFISYPSSVVGVFDGLTNWRRISHRQKRETYRLLKHEALQENNRIYAMRFHAQEMAAYSSELRNWKGFRATFNDLLSPGRKIPRKLFKCLTNVYNSESSWKKTVYSFSILWKVTSNCDLIILRLNHLSNGYGLNPFRGLAFILLSALLVFSIYVPVLHQANFDLSVSGVLEWFDIVKSEASSFPLFLYPAHPFDFMMEKPAYLGLPIVIDIFGRVVIGYGVYQTIQAFRKYGRF